MFAGGRRVFFVNDERGLIGLVPPGSLVTIRASFVDMKKNINGTPSVKTLERDLKIASSILEWEMGDIWGHIGVRLAGEEGIMVKSIRAPAGEDERKDWLVRFDYLGKKISGVVAPPFEE